MSTKSKASSKNKKAPAKKTVKKAAAKKVAPKKAAKKPVAKTKPVKKATTKAKAVAKKPVAKKAAPKKAVKKAAPKKVIKKAIKKVAPKKAVKKAAPKKVAKKATVKKIVKKIAPKKAVKKVVVKKAAPKKVAKPVAKKAVKKTAPKAKPAVKKAITPPVAKAAKKEAKPLHSKTSSVKEIKHIIDEVVHHKAEKPVVAAKTKKEKAPVQVVKKPIVAPTTFRKEEEVQTKPMKEPAGKFEMEFVIRASEDMVYEFVSTESGLSEWFCDDVNIRNGIFTFNWDGQEQQAKLVKEIPPMFIRYQWLDKNDGSYFEFRTQKDELTNDISLIITDFASDKFEEESSRLLWHSQVDKLLHVLGSFF